MSVRLPSFGARFKAAISVLRGIEAPRNALGPGLGLPSGNPSQGRSMGTPAQTRDVSPVQRNEAVATHRILRDRVPVVRALNNAIVDLALGDQGMVPIFKSGDPDYDARALAYYKLATRRQSWDVTGQDNGASMQRLVLRSVITDGEIFGAQILSPYGTTQRQLIVTEQIGGSYYQAQAGLIDGIEYNAFKRPTRYHVNEATDSPWQTVKSKTRPIDARYMMHVYDRERATQKRGLPWGYTGLNHGIDCIDTAELLKATMKMNAAVIGTHTTPTGDPALSMHGLLAAARESATAGTAAAASDTQKDTAQATRFLDVFGAMIPVFKAGEGMTFLQGRPAANEIEFMGWLLAQYAIGLGLPIDVVTGLGTGSAATHANADIVQRFLKGVQRIIVDDWNQPSTENLLSNGIVAYYFPDRFPGVMPLQPPRDPSRFSDIQWRGPRGYQVNKTRDAKSNIDLMARGLKTWEEYCAENGDDPVETRAAIDAGLEVRYNAWVAKGWPVDRFWQREYGTAAQPLPPEQATTSNT